MKPATEKTLSARRERARPVIAWQIGLAVLATVACGGCVSIGKRIDPETLTQIKIGVSTRAEVEELLGSPWTVSDSPTGGVTLTYFRHRAWLMPPGRMIATGLGLSKVPYGGLAGSALKRLWTGGSSKMECVTLTFDGNGTVSNVSTFVLGSEGGDGLFDRNRRSFGWTSRNESDSNGTETPLSVPDHHPESAEPGHQPRDPVANTSDTAAQLETGGTESPSVLDHGPEKAEDSIQRNDAVDGCSIESTITVSRHDDRFPKMAEAVDGIALKIKDTDPEPDADVEVYRDGEHILQLKDWPADGRAFVEGRSGKRYELRLLDINDETETIRVEIAGCE